jgi:hypothetical protein
MFRPLFLGGWLVLILIATGCQGGSEGSQSPDIGTALDSYRSELDGRTLPDLSDGFQRDSGELPALKRSPELNDCCEEHPSPGCTDPAISAFICGAYPHCCNTNWDMMCVTFAQQMDKCSAPPDCECLPPKVCYNNGCCLPNCTGMVCGSDGCGGSCGSCNDDNACTIDPCILGECRFVERNCYDSNPCTVDSCDPASGCINTPGVEVCNGTDDDCDGKTDEGVSCDDANPCTIDACGAAGCVHTARPLGAACSDGDACTTGDSCRLGAGKLVGCVGRAKLCSPPINSCDRSQCNPAKGVCEVLSGCDDQNPCTTDTCGKSGCVFKPVAKGTACSDGNGCTVGDRCEGSLCLPGAGSPCEAQTECHQVLCKSNAGAASCAYPKLADGVTCDDRDACTAVDTCKAGACVGAGQVPNCNLLVFDLGWPIGPVVFEPIPQNQCRLGSKTISPCNGLPFCQVTATACPGTAGEFTTISLEAVGDFGPFGSRAVQGPWVLGAWCLSAELDATLLGDLQQEIGGAPFVSVCLEPGELKRHVTLPEWRPFPWEPGKKLGPVVGDIGEGAAPLRFDLGIGDYAPLAAVGGPQQAVTLANARLEARLVGGSVAWQKTLTGDLAIRVSEGESPDYEGPVVGVINPGSAGGPSLKAQVDFLEVWPSSFPGFGIDDAEITVVFDVVKKRIRVGLAGHVRTPFPGTDKSFDFQVEAGEQDWNAPELWLSGQGQLLDKHGAVEALDAPGLQPAEGPLCLVLSNADLPEVESCGAVVARGLHAFFRARALRVIPNPPMIDAVLSIDSLPPEPDEMAFSGESQDSAELITSDMKFPGVQTLTLHSVRYSSILLDSSNTRVDELTGPAVLLPDEAQAEPIEGSFTVRTTTMILGLTTTARLEQSLETRGRWIEPLGLPNLALDDATFLAPPLTITATTILCPPPVVTCLIPLDFHGMNENLPATRLGFDGTAYRKQGGDWPAEPPASDERCNDAAAEDEDEDGKANCEDPDCTGHLACAAKATNGNIHAVGLTFFSQQPVVGAHKSQKPVLVLRLDYGPEAFASMDLDAALSGVHDAFEVMSPALASILGGIAGFGLGGPLGMALGSAMGAFLAEQVADLFPSPQDLPFSLGILDLKLEGLSARFATDNLDLWNERYQAGLTARIDGRLGLDGPKVNGLPAPGQPFTLNGAMDVGFGMRYSATVALPEMALDLVTKLPLVTKDNIVADPFQRSLRFSAPGAQTFVSVPHDGGLDLPGATLEGWVRRASWSKSEMGSVLAEKVSAGDKSSNGYSIGLGRLDAKTGKARVTVKFFKGKVVRVLQSDPVVPADQMVHLAVSWGLDAGSGETLVAVYVDGLRQALSDSRPPFQTPAVAIGPGPNSARLILARNLLEVDDLRLWKRVRSAGEIVGEARFLAGDYSSDANLALRFEFDYDDDANATVHNTRYFPSGYKRHGAVVGEFQLPQAESALAQLQLVVPDDPASTAGGFWLRSGFRLPSPDGNVSLRADLQIADGAASGTFLAEPLKVINIKGLGSFTLSSDGAIKAADATFDDLLFGRIDLVGHSLSATGRLAYKAPWEEHELVLAEADFTYSTSEDIFSAIKDHLLLVQTKASEAVTPLVLRKAGQAAGLALKIKAQSIAFRDEMNQGVRRNSAIIKGELEFLGRRFVNDAMELLPDKLTCSNQDDFDEPLWGINFAAVSLDLTFDFTAWTLCGEGTGVAGGLTCDLNLCFGPNNSTTGTARCGGSPVCTKNSDCPGDMICLGIVCTDKLPLHAPCVSDGQCASGTCDLVCYSKLSQDLGDSCFYLLDDECKKGLTCVYGACAPFHLHGDECTETDECEGETVCRDPAVRNGGGFFGFLQSGEKQCLYESGSRQIGAGCQAWDECISSECGLQKTCKCTTAWCNAQPGSNYCGGDGACHPKRPNNEGCCGNNECQSGHCSAFACMVNYAGFVLSTGSCYSPGTVPIGGTCANSDNCAVGFCAPDRKCRCDGHEDCPSSKHCNRLPTTGELGRCLDRLGEWRDCLDANDCAYGSVCGAEFQPVDQCFLPGTRSYAQSCLADTHCNSGRCEPSCGWNWTDCNPVSFFEALARGDLGVFADCGCSARCSCQNDQHCPNGQFCDGRDLFGYSFKECSGKKGFGSPCSRDSMCSSGHCVTGNTGVKNCGCDNDGQCGLGRKCNSSGRCVLR